MASLYKKPVILADPKTGERIKTKSKKWWGRFTDEDGREKRVPLATDKSAAQAMLSEQVRRVERRLAGLSTGYDEHHKRPLKKHVTDFARYLRDKGSSSDHVKRTESRIRALLKATKTKTISQISSSRVQSYLGDLCRDDLGLTTVNYYLTAIKMFTRRLVKDRRTLDDRLVHLSKMNAETDRRRVRRALTMDEFTWLLKAAEGGPPIQRLSGPDRVILYIIAGYTGYRRNEIGSVAARSFDFATDPPTMTVAAGYSKRRREDVLPLRVDFAERIEAFIAGKRKLKADKPLLAVQGKRTAEMIAKDLAAARALWIDEAKDDPAERKRREKSTFLAAEDEHGRVVDFHALRTTFITNLSRSDVAPKTAQLLARHCDINLTMNTYTMLGVMDTAAAVETLPAIPTVVGRPEWVSSMIDSDQIVA
jgi:site-specific recombinase XerD